MRYSKYIAIAAALWFQACKPVGQSSAVMSGESPVEATSTVSAPELLDPLAYLQWVESDEGLRLRKRIDNIQFTLQYTPPEYLALKPAIDSLQNWSAETLDIESNHYADMQFYKLRIAIDGFQDEIMKYNDTRYAGYEERVRYYAFGMQKDLWLIDGKDTLPCVLFNYERAFNLSPYSDFQLAFKNNGSKASKTLVFNDRYLGLGKVMMVLDKQRLSHIPKVTL